MIDFQCFDRSTTSGFYTDMHWRCEVTEEVNWFQAEFDDSSWSNAFQLPSNATDMAALDALLSDFDAAAQLVWHYDYENVDTVYCRGRLCTGIQW